MLIKFNYFTLKSHFEDSGIFSGASTFLYAILILGFDVSEVLKRNLAHLDSLGAVHTCFY